MNRIFLLGLFLISTVNAQDYFPTNSGVKSKELNYQAFIGGREISLETHQTELWKRYSNKNKSK